MQQMQSVWQGGDHQAFINQLEQFRPQLQKMVPIIEEYARFLLYCANEYQRLQQDRIASEKPSIKESVNMANIQISSQGVFQYSGS